MKSYYQVRSISYEKWKSLPRVLRTIQPVYGGFIGEKLSKDCTNDVWESLKTLGITRIIDLRYDYNPKDFKTRCEEYGIGYFSYPIHNDPKAIAHMVNYLSRFTEMLTEGHFYMQGVHSAYVALSVYWAFCPCPGMYPYELRCEIRHNASLMRKILPILHAMNSYEEECYKDNPVLTPEYFEKQRKQIRDFAEHDGPLTASYSFVDFTRAYRNETTVYDISMKDIGIIGYLYTPDDNHDNWEFDITLSPSMTYTAECFEDAQLKVVEYLCDMLPGSIKWPALPDSTKRCVSLLRNTFKR